MTKMNLNKINSNDFEEAFNKALVRAIKEHFSPVTLQDKDLLTRKETARILSISLPTLHNLTQGGIIRAYRIGHRVLYKQEDIDNALRIIVPPNERVRRNGK